MANTKDAYMKWKEQGLLDSKLKIISDYYSYKEARGLIYNLLGISEATWERLKKRHEEIRFTIAEAKKLHEQLLLVSITRRAEGEYYEDTQTIIESFKQVKVDYQNKFGWYGLFSKLISLLNSNKNTGIEILLNYMFNETLSSYQREYILDVMIKRNFVTYDFLVPVVYDSEYEIASKARKYLKRMMKID